jgi:hypothetical protein
MLSMGGMGMTLTGVVRGRRVELEGDVTLPEGTRVRVTPEEGDDAGTQRPEMTLAEWLVLARNGRQGRPLTSDSTELLREMREERSSR